MTVNVTFTELHVISAQYLNNGISFIQYHKIYKLRVRDAGLYVILLFRI